VKTSIPNLSRAELIQHLRGRPRAEVVEAALELHAARDTRTIATARVPLGTAIGMASLAGSSERMKLRVESPDLFTRKPAAHEVDSAKAFLRGLYTKIDISVRGGAEKRREFRNKYPDAFR